ncbi:MAG: hypothetical protein HKN92_04100 [Chitinophagales bacterium]|nr:hypothetical protein [Chitinophagales bacterium]
MLNFLKKYQVFIAVFLFLIGKHLFKYILLVNEADLLPVAKHVVNPDWIPGDWYLGTNLEGNYRFLFNMIFGSLATFLPLEAVSVVGRLFFITVFSYFAQQISNYYKIPFWFFIPFLFLYSNNHSVGAREWMINGLESKSIAYSFVLLAILRWLKKDFKLFFLFCGLAVSFHVLVGAFAALTFVIAMFMNPHEFKPYISSFFRNSWIGVVAGSFGLFFILKFLFESPQTLSPDPDLIYTLIRVPHHVLPSTWNMDHAISFGGISILVLIIVFFRSKDVLLKLLVSIPLASLVFMLIGFILYWTGKYTLLKFYWFRYPDAILPLFAFIVILPILFEFLAVRLKQSRKWLDGIFALSSVALFVVFFATIFPGRVEAFFDKRPIAGADLTDDIVEMCSWIRTNTEEDALFLVNPFFQNFYTLAERPMVVSVKHFPQSAEHVHEWYVRLSDIYGEPLKIADIQKSSSEIQREYREIPIERVKSLDEKYDIDYFLSIKKREDLKSSLLYHKGSYYLYGLD